MKLWLTGFALLWIGLGASAVELPPLPENPQDVVTDTDKSVLECAEIPAALAEYNELARANESALADFLLEVTNLLYTWYELLLPLENKQGPIEAGTFRPVQEGAEQIDSVVGMVYDNSEQLKQRMEIIMTSLEQCL